MKDSVKGTIIKFNKKNRSCGIEVSASVCIVKTGSDTIRVLSYCEKRNFRAGEHITIFSSSIDPFSDEFVQKASIGLPYDSDYVKLSRWKGKPIYRVNEYDDHVFETTWGDIKRRHED